MGIAREPGGGWCHRHGVSLEKFEGGAIWWMRMHAGGEGGWRTGRNLRGGGGGEVLGPLSVVLRLGPGAAEGRRFEQNLVLSRVDNSLLPLDFIPSFLFP